MTDIRPVTVITGASSGIGLHTAVLLARKGHRVVAALRDTTRRRHLEDAAGDAMAQIDVLPLDVTDHAAAARLAAEVEERYGRVDALINNAGFALGGLAEDVSSSELQRQFDTNFFGHVAVTRAFLPLFRKQPGRDGRVRGHIVMVASVLGRVATPGVSSYVASKFALEGWSMALRMELRSLGVRVALIEPGAFATDIWTRNVAVAEAARSGNSPNRERNQRFARSVKQGANKLPGPAAVSHAIWRVLQMQDPPLHTVVGRDARALLWMDRLLPQRALERVLLRHSRLDG